MESILNNTILSNEINEYFGKNIKLSYISCLEVIIITNDDKLYKFDKNEELSHLLTLSDYKAFIESTIVENLSNKNITYIASGWEHVLARTTDGRVYCWGFNHWGQLGNGQKDDYMKKFHDPEFNEFLTNENIIDIRCGSYHSLALTEKGELFSWGSNKSGQIGSKTEFICQLIPLSINGFNGEKVIAISCGTFQSMALTEKGNVFSWGWNKFGQLGHMNAENSYTPKPIELSNIYITKISFGSTHGLLLSSGGDIYESGTYDPEVQNVEQILGFRKVESSVKFIDIATIFDCTDSLALSEDGDYYHWGESASREIIKCPKKIEFDSFNDYFISNYSLACRPIENIFPLKYSLTNNCNYSGFDEMELLGTGSFGTVYKARERFTQNVFAVKKVIIDEKNVSQLLTEFKSFSVIQKLSHENIVKYFRSWLENNYSIIDGQSICDTSLSLNIQMELCDKTLRHLIDEIENCPQFKSDDNLKIICYYISSNIFIEILEGVDYLHKQNPQIIHRDLKPENILLKKGLNGKCVKIADFGLLATHRFSGQLHSLDKGSLKYMAPEVISDNNYDTKSDIYGLGIILEELVIIDIYDSLNVSKFASLLAKIQNASNLISRMKSDIPSDRPNCDEILLNKQLWTLNAEQLNLCQEIDAILNTISDYYSLKTFKQCVYTKI